MGLLEGSFLDFPPEMVFRKMRRLVKCCKSAWKMKLRKFGRFSEVLTCMSPGGGSLFLRSANYSNDIQISHAFTP